MWPHRLHPTKASTVKYVSHVSKFSNPMIVFKMFIQFVLVCFNKNCFVGSVVEWLKRRDPDRHGLGSKPTRFILLCLWKQHFMALSPAWWSWQAVLN